ncbi:MAG: glycosyltransferase, partial [Alicyclobacillus macrosporangiidus]|uniref:glycosyltransferase n=1 Tax=Alicyclobacillus macrosporangiidus TaxID=392015 RepID=UPI0034E93431|nr:glycosyltransferase [Alicyclobacillus macrosporangiidus]
MVRRRVLYVLPSLAVGGAERMVVHLATRINRDRFEVAVVTLSSPVGTELETTLHDYDIPVWHLNKERGFHPKTYGRLHEIYARYKPDIVHTHQYVLRYTLPLMVINKTIRGVHTVHNIAEREVGPLGRYVNRLAFRFNIIPVAIAREVAASIARVYGLYKIPVIPNGIPIEAYREPKIAREVWRAYHGFGVQDIIFVNVARLSAQKNQFVLIDAFASGPARWPNTFLLLVGDGEDREHLR